MPGDPWNPGGYFSILALSSKPFSQPVFIDFSSPYQGFPGGSVRKESTCNAVHLGSIPGLQRSPGGGNSNPLQYSCLGNSMDRGAWWATSPWGHKESDTTECLSTQSTAKRVLLLLTCAPVFNQPLIKADYFFLNFKLVRNVLLGSMLQMITISPFKVF